MNSEVWATRREAERATAQGPLQSFGRLFNEILVAIDETAVRLERTSAPYGRVCALLLIKGRNFCVGCYSLAHDGLAQEAGALFRPFLETMALMKYFRLDPNRVGVAIKSGKVPEPRRVDKAIASAGDDAVIRKLRGLLSETASHASLRTYSMGHLVPSGNLRYVQTFNEKVLKGNLQVLVPSTVLLMAEGVNCLQVGSGLVDETFIDRANKLRHRAFILAGAGKRLSMA